MRTPSPKGKEEAERQVNEFIRELLNESARIARHRAADEASPEHIAEAAAHIYAGSAGRLTQVLSTVGGIITGAASAALVTFITIQPINQWGVIVSTGSTIVGAIMATVGLVWR